MGQARSKTAVKGAKSKLDIAKLLKLKLSELDEFEREGLFEFVDKAKQQIDEKNLERLRVAASLKHELGVNAAGIDVILNMREKMTRMRSDMNSFMTQVRRKLENRLAQNVKNLKREVE